MQFNEINVAEFNRVYAVSFKAFSDEACLKNWIATCGVPEDTVVDLIGPAALHNWRATALSLGQCLRKSEKVLFINVDDSELITNFIAAVDEYKASPITFTTIIPIEGDCFKVAGQDGTFKLVLKPLQKQETEMSQQPTTQVQNIQNHYDPTMDWDGAKAFLKTGTSVRRLSHGPFAFVGYNEGKVIEADKFWVEQNKQAAIRNGGSMTVKPYYTFCDGKSVDMAWRANMEDETATDWVEADHFVMLSGITRLPGHDYELSYQLHKGKIEDGANTLVPLYDLIATQQVCQPIIVTGNHTVAGLINKIMTDMKRMLLGDKPFGCNTIEFYGSLGVNTDLVESVIYEIHSAHDKSTWDLENTIKDLINAVEVNPNSSIVIDVKGLVEDLSFEEHEFQQNQERALHFVNQLISAIGSNPAFKNVKWASVDIDSESIEA